MSKILSLGEAYSGRRPDASVLNVTVEREVHDLLRRYAPGKKMGALVSRLVLEFHARQEERHRLGQVSLYAESDDACRISW